MNFLNAAHRNQYYNQLLVLDGVGQLSKRVKGSCSFKARVHAEVILADLFRSRGFDYFENDTYIGCSKPTCFCCYHYLQDLCPRLELDGSHNKIYIRLQPLGVEGDRDKRSALDVLIHRIRKECLGVVYEKKSMGIHHDTLTEIYSEMERLDGGSASDVDEADVGRWHFIGVATGI